MTKIAVFFGGKITRHLVLVRKAAQKLGVDLDLVSYNRVSFDTVSDKIKLKKPLCPATAGHLPLKKGDIKNTLSDYDVLFFRTTGKHWEEVNLILDGVKRDDVVIVDPLVKKGRPSDACKAYQMLELKKAGIEVPKTLYGSLWYLYETMSKPTPNPSLEEMRGTFQFPIIVKGSGGDRGTRVFKADNLEQLEKLVRDLRKSETEEGKRYMLQEYIPNDGDYRILVLGEKVLGVMKRSSQNKNEFRNNYSAGGKVEVADLSQEIKQLAIKAAKVCGLAVAGVDVMAKSLSAMPHLPLTKGRNKNQMSNNPKDYVILEVNKGPQFSGFMKATGIDVPAEIVKFLVELKPTCSDKSELPPLKREANY